MLNVVEAFSGIGSQAEALKNIHIEHKISAIIEWEVGALFAYDIIHNGPQDLTDYRHHTKESLVKELYNYKISSSGKDLLEFSSLSRMSMLQLKSIYAAIERTGNLIDISSVKAKSMPDNVDVLTYSFPCQDLSVSSYWHKNFSGIDREANNRSGLLWQVERLLKDYCNIGKKLPNFLLMENVSAILSKRNIDNFNIWKKFLEDLGYYNQVYTLNSKNFGIPQSRERTYMISVLVEENIEKRKQLEEFFFENNLENIIQPQSEQKPIGEFLRLDYKNKIYRKEAIEATPNFTPSREKIYLNNKILATDDMPADNMLASTLTTKQDRHPNSGIIEYKKLVLKKGSKYRNLTPRESFLLMGFKEETYDSLIESNIKTGKNRTLLSQSKLYKLTGNSIVVPVLEKIFKQIEFINNNILQKKENKNT